MRVKYVQPAAEFLWSWDDVYNINKTEYDDLWIPLNIDWNQKIIFCLYLRFTPCPNFFGIGVEIIVVCLELLNHLCSF